jgi:hypothetical protein
MPFVTRLEKRPFVAWLLGIDIAFTSERGSNQIRR